MRKKREEVLKTDGFWWAEMSEGDRSQTGVVAPPLRPSPSPLPPASSDYAGAGCQIELRSFHGNSPCGLFLRG